MTVVWFGFERGIGVEPIIMENGVDHLFPSAYQLDLQNTQFQFRSSQENLYIDHHQNQVPSPAEHQPIDEEPLYVNAKQYFRILKRRVARARLEEVHRLSRQRKVPFVLRIIFPIS